MTKRRELAKQIAQATEDAYSFNRYGAKRWEACCFMLLGYGFTAREVEAIMRSKWTRWAGDASNNRYGYINSADLKRFANWTADDTRRQVHEMAAPSETYLTFAA